MKLSLWRKCALAVLSLSLLNMGMMSAAGAAIVDTAALVTTDRDADLGAVRTQLARADVRTQMQQMGVEAAAVEQRLARLNDHELHRLAADLRSAPAGGDGVLAVIGAVFVVLLVLEVTGVIDIFKKR